MKLLVTGGAGFIGSNFIRYWIEEHDEDEMINFDKLTYAGNLENLKEVQENPNYAFVKGDICDRKQVDAVMKNVDTVVHFAAESHVDRSIQDAAPFIKTNIEGTYILLESALKNKIERFHHISTDEVFGALDLDTETKFNDKTPYDPRSPYSATKAAADHLVRAYHTTYGLPITISNCSNNFGPFQFPEKLIALAITNILEGKKEDMIEYVKDRPGHDRRYAINWGKIHESLGWEPQYDFDHALELTVNWYKDNPDWWKNVKSGQYQEYYKKQYA